MYVYYVIPEVPKYDTNLSLIGENVKMTNINPPLN